MEEHRGDKEMERIQEVAVVDASVVTKWFVEEEYSDEALELRSDYIHRRVDLASPQLLLFEVVNSLRYNPEFGEEDLKKSAKALEEYTLWLFPLSGKLSEKTVDNALKYGITIYDSSYISLGELEGRRVYTADEKLLTKVRNTNWVLHISEYQPKA